MKVKGCKHYETKVVKMAEGGSVPAKKQVLQTKKNADGSQQYVRGDTPMDRINTLSTYQNKAYQDSERAYREGDMNKSNRALKGALMLDKAQQEEAKDELARRGRK